MIWKQEQMIKGQRKKHSLLLILLLTWIIPIALGVHILSGMAIYSTGSVNRLPLSNNCTSKCFVYKDGLFKDDDEVDEDNLRRTSLSVLTDLRWIRWR